MAESEMRVESEEDAAVIYLQGPLNREQVPSLWPRLTEALNEAGGERVIIDCRDVSGIDSAGLAMLRMVDGECGKRRLDCIDRNLPAQAAEYRQYAEERAEGRQEEKAASKPGPVARFGQWGLDLAGAARSAVAFFGTFLIAGGRVLRRPGQLNMTEILYQMQKAGAEAVPFVFLLSGLMGYIIGMQSTATVSALGAGIRVANAVTLGTMKEMAPLLTGIIIIGRSGAAYAAEIGTMKVKEEINALEVMGFDPIHFLVMPRVLGLALAGPLLTIIADAAGLIGGAIQGMLVLGLSPVNYMVEVGQTIEAALIYEGVIKGFAFAMMIGLNGCFHGLRTGTAAESVGVQTTVSVVSGIFLIVILDALLAGIFHVFSL